MNEGKKPIRILWISRHPIRDEQLSELHGIFGMYSVTQVSRTFKSAAEIVVLAEEMEATEIVAILPLHLMAQLTQTRYKPIRAVMHRHVDPETGGVTFLHSHFERVERVDVVTVPLVRSFTPGGTRRLDQREIRVEASRLQPKNQG
jgi:hypothetical protein